MMFNATKFTVALVTKDGFSRIDNDNIVYQYVWTGDRTKKGTTRSRIS